MTAHAPQIASDPLAAQFARARAIARRHGRTYALATRLLGRPQRDAVHALYAFARIVDDQVDVVADASAARCLEQTGAALHGRLTGRPVPPPSPLAPVFDAVVATIERFDLDPAHFDAFLASMRMDIPGDPGFRTHYGSWAELGEYTHGSAAAIGLMLLPILGAPDEAAAGAAALGDAFQLTNFIRDVGEDLDRGRVYLPTEVWAAHGVTVAELGAVRRSGVVTPGVRAALAEMIEHNRAGYRAAVPAIDLLPTRVRPAIRTAAELYADILDHIERAGYPVLTRQVVVPRRRRLQVVARNVVRGGSATMSH